MRRRRSSFVFIFIVVRPWRWALGDGRRAQRLRRWPIADRLWPGYFAPVLPAFFLSTSPVYRTPFCLYGSGLRRRRRLAATWPTSSRSTPATVMRDTLPIV